MSNSKISALTSAATVVGTEVLPIVQSSATVKVTVANLTPGLSTITATKGGTGQTSYAVGDIIYADTTITLAKLADVATGNALISGGVSTVPSWGKVGLTTHVSGTLPVANGGTNASSASITAFNNITGYSASGATGTTTTNLVFSTSPSITTPTLVGDATLSTGNLVIGTSGKGIDFSATSGSGTSELFADYEEGTWSPVLQSEGGSFGAITYNTLNGGRYTKIGSVVHIQCLLYTNSVTLGTATLEVRVGGLPFTAVASSGTTQNGFSSVAVSQTSAWVVNQPSAGLVRPSSTQIGLYYRLTANGASNVLTVSDVTLASTGNALRLTGTYIAA